MLKSNRSTLEWFLLSLITCGIYNLFFVYDLVKDVNIICASDNDETPGLLQLIIFGFLTCGIYSFWWYYKLGNRLQNNASKYNLNFDENGTTVLLWMIFGSVLCGIGSIIAMHIIISNTNKLATEFNNSRQ